MTTTIEALGRPAQVHHRRGLAFAVAALIAVGGAVGVTMAVAADSDSSNPAPAQVTSNASQAEDSLVVRYGQSAPESVPFSEQPLLRTSGAH